MVSGDDLGLDHDIFVLEREESNTVHGIENMLKLNFHQFSGFFNFRYTIPEKRLVAGQQIVKDIAKYKIKLGLSHRYSDFLTGGFFMDHWAGIKTEANTVDLTSTEVYDVPAWTTFSVNLRLENIKWNGSQLAMTVFVENLTDETYYHANGGGTSPVQILQPPRNIRLSADFSF